LFVASQVLLGLLIEVRLPELLDPPYWTKHRRLRKRLNEATDPALLVVMLGSSRTTFGFRGQVLEGLLGQAHDGGAVVFNLGLYGTGPVAHQVYLRRLLDDGIRPDLLLVEVMPALLHEEFPPREVYHLPAHRLDWRDLPLVQRHAGNAGRTLQGDWWWSTLLPARGHGEAIVSGILPSLLEPRSRPEWWSKMDDSGWVPFPGQPASTRQERLGVLARTRQQWGEQVAGLRPGGPACAALEELLAEARRAGVNTALVLMPEGPAMRSWYSKTGFRDLRAYLAGLGQHVGCPLIDAREWMVEDDFNDSHHLFPDSARRFSERLGQEAVLPLLGYHTSQSANASARDLTGSRRGMNSCPRKPL
jgi:hypothetical protein